MQWMYWWCWWWWWMERVKKYQIVIQSDRQGLYLVFFLLLDFSGSLHLQQTYYWTDKYYFLHYIFSLLNKHYFLYYLTHDDDDARTWSCYKHETCNNGKRRRGWLSFFVRPYLAVQQYSPEQVNEFVFCLFMVNQEDIHLAYWLTDWIIFRIVCLK